jgi:hypothetical protein
VVVAAGGVRHRGQDEDQGATVETGGEVAEVNRMPVGDARGGPQDPQLSAAADD